MDRSEWDYEQLGVELIRAWRGQRSLAAFSRRLGSSSNMVASWEAKRRWPTAARALWAAERSGVDVCQALVQFYGQPPRWLGRVAASTPEGIVALLGDWVGNTPLKEIVERTGRSRYAVSRWLKGQALDLYHELGREQPNENFFYSPYSISTAMAMAYVGARTQTKAAIASTLRFSLPDDTLHQGFNALDRSLQARERPATESRLGVNLGTANDIWASELLSERPTPEYVDALALDYRAGVNLVSFGDEAASRATINGEISCQTQGRIEELIAPGIIQPGITTMLLTNTVYFKAGWAEPFLQFNTQPASFYNLGGGPSTVQMMNATSAFEYAESDTLQAIRLPYEDGETALVVLLPKADFVAVESGFDLAQWSAVRARLQSTIVHVRLPVFSMRSALELKDALQSLGMYAGFEDSAS